MTDTETEVCRGEIELACGYRDCHVSYQGDDLARIAQRAARHMNKEHGDDLRHGHEAIDEVVYGGHHIQGDSYEVRKYKVYITSFDVMKRVGKVDGMLVPMDDDRTCPECFHHIPDPNDRLEDDPNDAFNDDWMCRACRSEQEIERRKSENEQLTEWCT